MPFFLLNKLLQEAMVTDGLCMPGAKLRVCTKPYCSDDSVLPATRWILIHVSAKFVIRSVNHQALAKDSQLGGLSLRVSSLPPV